MMSSCAFGQADQFHHKGLGVSCDKLSLTNFSLKQKQLCKSAPCIAGRLAGSSL